MRRRELPPGDLLLYLINNFESRWCFIESGNLKTLLHEDHLLDCSNELSPEPDLLRENNLALPTTVARWVRVLKKEDGG